LLRITFAASRGSCGSTPLSNQEGGVFVKKRAARAMRTMRTGAERARMRGRWVLAGSFERERRAEASPEGASDTFLLLLIVGSGRYCTSLGRERVSGAGTASNRRHVGSFAGNGPRRPHGITVDSAQYYTSELKGL
jgi:hypothetical protein